MSAFIQRDGTINLIVRAYLVENNKNRLLTRRGVRVLVRFSKGAQVINQGPQVFSKGIQMFKFSIKGCGFSVKGYIFSAKGSDFL